MKSCHPRETGNIGYTRRRQTKHNTEKLATQGTQDEDKQNTQHNRYWTPIFGKESHK